MIYTQLVEFEDDDKYCTAVANNVQEARNLLETGFEYVCSHKMRCYLERENRIRNIDRARDRAENAMKSICQVRREDFFDVV